MKELIRNMIECGFYQCFKQSICGLWIVTINLWPYWGGCLITHVITILGLGSGSIIVIAARHSLSIVDIMMKKHYCRC